MLRKLFLTNPFLSKYKNIYFVFHIKSFCNRSFDPQLLLVVTLDHIHRKGNSFVEKHPCLSMQRPFFRGSLAETTDEWRAAGNKVCFGFWQIAVVIFNERHSKGSLVKLYLKAIR